jgi:hypothetical protein
MTIERVVYSVLSGLAGGYVYPDTVPDGTPLPHIIFASVVDVPSNTADDFAAGIANSRVQVDVYEATRDAARTLADTVKATMAAAAVAHTLSNVCLSSRPLYESDVKQYRVAIDFSCWL